MRDESTLDEALAFLAPTAPELGNGFTNHGPMACEALCALGRAGAVMPWLERYGKALLPREKARERIDPDDWRAALGRLDRFADWAAFFREELREASWREVAARWTVRFTPGIPAAATHGIIRVGHAVRSLGVAESALRLGELADGLAYWAATYETLPGLPPSRDEGRTPQQAILDVPVVPPAERRFAGSITSSLEVLPHFPPFDRVLGLIRITEPPQSTISDLTETFARVLVANASDLLTAIVFVHGVTSIAAVRTLVPLLDAASARDLVRRAWQTSASLYATFANGPVVAAATEAVDDRDDLIDRAIAGGDEHAIKLAEACLREHDIRPAPAYLAAVGHAVPLLRVG